MVKKIQRSILPHTANPKKHEREKKKQLSNIPDDASQNLSEPSAWLKHKDKKHLVISLWKLIDNSSSPLKRWLHRVTCTL